MNFSLLLSSTLSNYDQRLNRTYSKEALYFNNGRLTLTNLFLDSAKLSENQIEISRISRLSRSNLSNQLWMEPFAHLLQDRVPKKQYQHPTSVTLNSPYIVRLSGIIYRTKCKYPFCVSYLMTRFQSKNSLTYVP